MKHTYGWIPNLPDQRDLLYIRRRQLRELPAAVDLRANCPPVYDQGDLGSCTANAIAAAVDFERMKQKLFVLAPPSRLFIYYNERALEGTTASDAGASLRDGFKTIATQGVCQEKHWPYNPAMFATEPNKDCYVAALAHKTIKYLSVAQSQTDMLDCLANGYPFVFGITVYDSFESDAVNASGNVPMPGPNEGVLGGHALLAVGYSLAYSPAIARIRFRNSWGTSWGDAGYGTIPIQYLTNPDLASDFWTIRLEE